MGSGEARVLSVLDSVSAPGWPVAAVTAGSHPLLVILQHQLQTSLEPLPRDSSRASASAPEQHGDQHPIAGEGLHTQQGPAVGQPGCQTYHPAMWSS